jgi:hypothetical protein
MSVLEGKADLPVARPDFSLKPTSDIITGANQSARRGEADAERAGQRRVCEANEDDKGFPDKLDIIFIAATARSK